MPRKSKSELQVASVEALGNLPEPPADLTAAQASVWLSVVATKPADWWDAANLPMLRALCVCECAAMVVDQQLNAFQPEWLETDLGLERFKELSKLRVIHTQRIESLLTKMRLTQQSRYDVQKAAVAHKKVDAPTGKRPWEG